MKLLPLHKLSKQHMTSYQGLDFLLCFDQENNINQENGGGQEKQRISCDFWDILSRNVIEQTEHICSFPCESFERALLGG